MDAGGRLGASQCPKAWRWACPGCGCVHAAGVSRLWASLGPSCAFGWRINTQVEGQDSAGEVSWFPSGYYDTNTQMSTASHTRALRAHVSAKVDVAQTMAGIPLGGLLSEPMQQPQGKEPSLPQLAHFT